LLNRESETLVESVSFEFKSLWWN